MNGLFGGGGVCGMSSCDLVLLVLLLNCFGGCGTMNGCNSGDVVWLILLLSCLTGGGCGCK